MESMVERVAKAIRRRHFERTRRLGAFDETVLPTENELDDARAAIEAMREPTPEMVEVGQNPIYTSFGMLMDGFDQNSIVLFNEVWRAVLDTALNEK